jgi:hypothetical protein
VFSLILKVKLARFRKPVVTCFLSYVEYGPNTNISSIIYREKYIQSMYPKVGLGEETKGGGEKERKIEDNNKVFTSM